MHLGSFNEPCCAVWDSGYRRYGCRGGRRVRLQELRIQREGDGRQFHCRRNPLIRNNAATRRGCLLRGIRSWGRRKRGRIAGRGE